MTQTNSHACNDLLSFPCFGSFGSHCTSMVVFLCIHPTVQAYPDNRPLSMLCGTTIICPHIVSTPTLFLLAIQFKAREAKSAPMARKRCASIHWVVSTADNLTWDTNNIPSSSNRQGQAVRAHTAWNKAYIMLVSCIDYALDMTCIQSVSQCFIVFGILSSPIQW